MDGYYWIKEWDNTTALVGAKFHRRGDVTIKYDDGVKQVLSQDYFYDHLCATFEPYPA